MIADATLWSWVYNAGRWTWHNPDGYNFISGPLADITLIGAGYAILRHHNCHVKGCWRLGRHPVQGTSYTVCGHHHPRGPATAAEIHAAHAAWLRRVEAPESFPPPPSPGGTEPTS
jgi:hypothetical protein